MGWVWGLVGRPGGAVVSSVFKHTYFLPCRSQPVPSCLKSGVFSIKCGLRLVSAVADGAVPTAQLKHHLIKFVYHSLKCTNSCASSNPSLLANLSLTFPRFCQSFVLLPRTTLGFSHILPVPMFQSNSSNFLLHCK